MERSGSNNAATSLYVEFPGRGRVATPGWVVIATIVVVVVGLLITVAIALFSTNLRDEQRTLALEASLAESRNQVLGLAADYDGVLLGLRGTVVSSDVMTRSDFRDAVVGSMALSELPGVQSLQWAIPVPADDVSNFDERLKTESRAAAQSDKSDEAAAMIPEDAKVHPPAVKPVNYVVDYVEPGMGNSQAFGLNLSALPGREVLIEEAITSGQQVRSGPVQLQLEGGVEKPGYVSYLPVYKDAQVPKTLEQRLKKFRGLLVGVFVAETIFGDVNQRGDFAIYDVAAADLNSGVIEQGDVTPGFLPAQQGLLFESQSSLIPEQADALWVETVDDRTWLVFYFGEEMDVGPSTVLIVLLVSAGLVLTALAATLMWVTGRYRAQTANDMATITKSAQQLHAMSMTDPLTLLANRRSLIRELSRLHALAIRQDSLLALLYLDVDQFKAINDRYGHRTGDELLTRFGERLVAVSREADVVGRLAGDEFCLAGIVASEADARSMVARVEEALAPDFYLDELSIQCSVSIGVVVDNLHTRSVEDVLDAADLAMYEAKALSDQTVVWFRDDLVKNRKAELQVRSWISEAIDHDAFELHYQPVVAVATGEVIGAEALLRLTPLAGEGVIGPERFLEIAERSHKIQALGLLVIERAIGELAAWRRDNPGRKFKVGINLSASQVIDPATLQQLHESLRRHDMSPDWVVLELTETVFVSDLQEIGQFMAAASKQGFGLSVDDYGVGYSNLERMSSLPFDSLKIDRSLITQIGESRSVGTIIASVTELAKQLGASVVAEGVETEEQALFVKGLGIQHMQGFLVSRPLASFSAAANVRMPANWSRDLEIKIGQD